MDTLKAFPKIFTLGQVYILDILQGEVEITEKVDGSQFVFGKLGGRLLFRSKGAEIYPNANNGIFAPAVQHVLSIADRIPDNTIFYGETLCKPKHNVLAYDSVPKNNIALFGVCDASEAFISDYAKLKEYADMLEIDAVPLVFRGEVKSVDEVFAMLDRLSFLGGQKIEGVVVKNYAKTAMIGNVPLPIMSGKYVSERFKEVHRRDWSKENTDKGKFEAYAAQFKSEARWDKAVQHLQEKGELEMSPRDIGKLITEVKRDIEEECKEDIKEWLWANFSGNIMRGSAAGLPEYYKRRLAQQDINN